MSSEKDTRKTTAKEIAKILLETNVVLINAQNPFVYVSGTISPIYCDLRLLMAFPKERDRIVDLLTSAIHGTEDVGNIDVIVGVATAGNHWAAWVAKALGKPMAYVRDAAKDHGRQQRIEGGVKVGQRAWVFEDLTSTGASAISAALALREIGATVDFIFSVFTYEFSQTAATFADAGVRLVTLCGITDLLEVAHAQGSISDDEERIVREWVKKGPVVATRVDQTA